MKTADAFQDGSAQREEIVGDEARLERHVDEPAVAVVQGPDVAIVRGADGQRLYSADYKYKGGWELSGWVVNTPEEAARLKIGQRQKRKIRHVHHEHHWQ